MVKALKPFKVRTKSESGKVLSGWRTVYATNEKDAALVDALMVKRRKR